VLLEHGAAEARLSRGVRDQQKTAAGLAQGGAGGWIERPGVAKRLAGPQNVHRPAEERRGAESLTVYAGGQRNAGIPPDEPGAEGFNHVRVGRLDLRRVEGLETPPAQVQRQQQPAVDGRRVQVNKPRMAPPRIVPRLPAGAVLPEVVPHIAHLHADRLPKALLDFHNELLGPIPAFLGPAQDRSAVNGIEVNAVEPAAVHHLGMVGGDFREQG